MANQKNEPYLNQPLAGRTAVVTGSAQNIGKAIALHFARAGANVVVNGHRNRAKLDQVVQEIQEAGGAALACIADVGDPDAVEKMVREAEGRFGAVDIAVSNVSVRRHQPLLDISIEAWKATLDIAGACVFLAGDSGSYITGQVIHLNGGQFMYH